MLRFKGKSREKPSILRTPNMKYSILSELAGYYGQPGFSFKYVDALFLFPRYCSMKTNANIFKAILPIHQNFFFLTEFLPKLPQMHPDRASFIS